MVGVFAQLERDLIGQRTREALAIRRREGVQLGRPRSLPEDVVARIVAERAEGAALQLIADRLTADDVPGAQVVNVGTPRPSGRCWSALVGAPRRDNRAPVPHHEERNRRPHPSGWVS
jgi:hypothetical protein